MAPLETLSAASVWPYTERNEVNVDDAIAELTAESNRILTDAERQAAFAFGRSLHDGFINDDLRADTDKTLAEVYALMPDNHDLAFREGHLERLVPTAYAIGGMSLRQAEGITTAGFMDAVRSRVANGGELDTLTLSTLAAQSATWYRGQLEHRLLQADTNDAEQPDVAVRHAQLDPALLLQKTAGLQAYRRYYQEVWRNLKQAEDSPLTAAKKTLAAVHLARVNSLLAWQYPSLVQLAEQLDASPQTDEVEQWRAQLESIAPVVAAVRRHGDDSDHKRTFMQRMDGIRNGVGVDDEGYISPVSANLEAFAQQIEAQAESLEMPEAQVLPEVTERLKNVRWKAEQLQEFLRFVLKEWELLSGDDNFDWHTAQKRNPATSGDNLWQVIITPEVSSLDANGKRKVIWVPEKFDRTLLQQVPSGALPVATHELAHVLQTEYDDALAAQLPLAGIKGRRSVTMKEMGAVYEEAKLQAAFGNLRPANTTYLRAMQAKLAGGNDTEVARAFIKARRLTHPEDSPANTAKAGTTATRLNRHGGFDSQPLDYLAQAFMLGRLKQALTNDKLEALALAGTSFSLHDAAALKRVGLLELPQTVVRHPAEDVFRYFFDYFDKANS
jgi:hypothetical protein